MEKLWTTREVARVLGIHEIDVEGLVRSGKLTGYRLGGQFLRFRPDQVEALKGTPHVRPNAPARTMRLRQGWRSPVRDFLYSYDLYLVSAVCLVVVIVYLIAS